MKKILCPTDFSEAGYAGIKYANELAKANSSTLVFCHTYFFPPVPPDAQPYFNQDQLQYTDEESKEKLEKLCTDLRRENPSGNVNYTYIVKNGFLFDELMRIVEEEQVDLIVMGTKGSKGLDQIIFGTISGTVLEGAKCPVLVIPQNASFNKMKEIVYATDLKNEEAESIEFVVELARKFEANIHFVNIQKENPEDVKEIISYALNNLLNESDYQNMAFHVIEDDDVINGVEFFAKQKNADLIVMGTYKRTLFQKLFHQSLSKKMAYSTQLPLLVLHKKQTQKV
ncbi:MAG TPA: universal stress protein [Cytophagaceae bacterium]